MTTLENLYYGNIIPHEIPIIKGSDYDVANRLVVRHDEALTATLTEQQKPFLEQDEMVEITGLEPRRKTAKTAILSRCLLSVSRNVSR